MKNFDLQNSTVMDLFSAGNAPDARLKYFRIPSIHLSDNDTFNVFCEARTDCGDYSARTILQSRSEDGGLTWSSPIICINNPPFSLESALGNPTVISGSTVDSLHLIYCNNYTMLYCCSSDDGGVSWSTPQPIALPNPLMGYDWEIIAIGPGHGIRTPAGRVITGFWMSKSKANQTPSAVGTLFSDNDGLTWTPGEILEMDSPASINPMEPCITLLSDSTFLLNIRRSSATDSSGKFIETNYRQIAFSPDGINGWSTPQKEIELTDPGCFGSMSKMNPHTIAFTNVNNGSDPSRQPLCLHISEDDGKSWAEICTYEPSQGGYSDIACNSTTCFVLYEYGWESGEWYRVQSIRFRTIQPAIGLRKDFS